MMGHQIKKKHSKMKKVKILNKIKKMIRSQINYMNNCKILLHKNILILLKIIELILVRKKIRLIELYINNKQLLIFRLNKNLSRRKL